MTDNCADNCKSIPLNVTVTEPVNDVNIYFEQAEPLIKEFQAAAVYTPTLTQAEKEQLRIITVNANIYINKEIKKFEYEEFVRDFPNLSKRLEMMPFLTQAEIFDFVTSTGIYTIYTLQFSFVVGSINLIRQLDNYFSVKSISQSSMGSFCSLVPNIFAKFKDLQNMFNNVLGLAGKLQDLISKIQNFSVAALIDQLKEKLKSVVDQIVEKVKSEIQGIVDSFKGVFGEINELARRTAGSIGDKFRRLKKEVDKIVEEGFVEYIKGKIDGLISGATSLFDMSTIDIEEIQFLILRFCALAGNIEKFFQDKLNPLKNLQSNLSSAYAGLSRIGSIPRAGVILAGGRRLTQEERLAGFRAASAVPTPGRSNPVNLTPGGGGAGRVLNPENVVGNPTISPVGRRNAKARILSYTPEELAEIPSFTQVTQGSGYNGLKLIVGNTTRSQLQARGMPLSAAWDNVQTLEIVMLLRLYKEWGRTITINSAFRPGAVNGVDNSLHMSGQAFDVQISSGQVNEFSRIAKSVGFGPTRFYPSDGFIHIDSANDRSW